MQFILHFRQPLFDSRRDCLMKAGEQFRYRYSENGLIALGDHLKTGHLWSLQNRPLLMA